MPFEEFVRVVAEIPDQWSDGHFISQSHYLFYKNLQIPDFVGKFELLEQDWQKCQEYLGVQFDKLPIRNKSEGFDWQFAYTSELKDLVYNRYHEDFKNFNYKK